MWKSKLPEFTGFCGMLLMFIAVSVCKGSKFLSSEEPETKYEHLSDSMVRSEQNQNIPLKDQVCRHYSILLYTGAVLFFSYLGNKLLGKYKERSEKMKAMRAMKKE